MTPAAAAPLRPSFLQVAGTGRLGPSPVRVASTGAGAGGAGRGDRAGVNSPPATWRKEGRSGAAAAGVTYGSGG
ncbi:hypothetical protein ABZ657_13035, partial [Streptomyces sp. NPDC007000]